MNPAWVGPSIGVLSIFLAITFYTLGRRARIKRPTWAIRSTNIVRDYVAKFPGLEIIFRGERVQTLTISRLVFWNRGGVTVDRNDSASADPIRIKTRGIVRILDVQMIQANNDASQFTVQLDASNNEAKLIFDFLDAGHGGVVQVIHTGSSSDDLTVRGTIKGAGAPVKRAVRGHFLPVPTSARFDRSLTPKTRRRIAIAIDLYLLFVIVIGLLAAVTMAINPLFLKGLWETIPQPTRKFVEVFLFGAAILASALATNRIETLGASLLPEGLMAFAEDPVDSALEDRGPRTVSSGSAS